MNTADCNYYGDQLGMLKWRHNIDDIASKIGKSRRHTRRLIHVTGAEFVRGPRLAKTYGGSRLHCIGWRIEMTDTQLESFIDQVARRTEMGINAH